ncbi:MAG: SH3 domain-containing protein [Clostridia bacterium]|nr:SH3 domain-containing protein [Clostridia bacterium]
MKKWIAMVLALCMLCGIVNVTYAEASKFQTISTSVLDFDIPAGVEYEIIDPSDDRFVIEWVCEGAYGIAITVDTNNAEYYWYQDNPQMAFCKEGFSYFSLPMTDCQYLDNWNMPNHQPVIAVADRGASFRDDYAFYHHYGPFGIQVAVNFWDKQPMEAAIEMAKPILQSVRKPGESRPVNAENAKQDTSAPVGKQSLTIGRASFELDADLEIAQVDGHRWMLMNDQYAVVFYYYEYGEDDIDFTDGDMQIDNCFFINSMATGDQQTALNVCNLVQRTDIGMPGGDDVLYIAIDGMVMLCHYYPNMGFMMMAQCQDGSLSDDKLLAIVEEIALSFQVDGMTAEEMAEYKAQAEAELAAIFATSVQAPDTEAAAEETPAEEDTAQKYVVITNSSANIRSGPDAGTAKVKTGLKGDRFPLLGEENNWYKIDVDGKTAYVSKGLTTVE